MKKLIHIFVIFIFLFLLPSQTLAHILQTDGSIGVIYHLEPDHDPVVGEPAHISFDIKDRDNKLTSSTCDCKAEIYLNDSLIHTQNLFINSSVDTLSNQMFNYTFPKRGVYKVIIKGKPKTNSTFDEFQIEYDQRVDKGEDPVGQSENLHTPEAMSSHSAMDNNSILILIVAAIAVILFVGIVGKNKKWFLVLMIASIGLLHIMPARLQCSHDSHCVNNHTHQFECCLPAVIQTNSFVVVHIPLPIQYKIIANLEYIEQFGLDTSVIPRAPPLG